MKLETLMEVLWAASQTHRVRSRFPSRGAMFLVAPPGQIKTSLLATFEEQMGVITYSDLTTTELVEARDLIAARKVNTIVLLDFQKIYERRADTASNIEGNLRSIIDEGFTSASFERMSKNAIQPKARALLLAAMTPHFYRRKLPDWEATGFARRVLWCVYTLKRPEVIQNALLKESPIELQNRAISMPLNLEIDLSLQPGDDEFIRKVLRRQQDELVPINLVKKILLVLRWKYVKRLRQKDKSHEILKDFSACLGGGGAEVDL